jgi:hypothetical protein
VGVNVGVAPVSAFLALIIAVILIGAVVYGRRHGHLRARGTLVAIAIIVALLVAFGMTGGLVPRALT